MRHFLYLILLLFSIQAGLMPAFAERIITANPSNYLAQLRILMPGDHLQLSPGEYKNGLPVHHLQGTMQAPIIISGPEKKSPPAVFVARSGHNTVSIINAGYVTIRNLVIDGRNLPVDGVKCEGHADWAHHIVLDGLLIQGHGFSQQIAGISTKCPAWNWVIRYNKIIGAGTGIYLGNSDGQGAFISGMIEHNLIADSAGYNLQIKHQQARPNLPGIPSDPRLTIIRHNIFSKANGGSEEMARPNVLVGHWPLTGVGMDDQYLIYGNFFYQNQYESLFQGEGNFALYSNVFVNHRGDAIRIQPHKDTPRLVDVFFNTIIASGSGIHLANREDDPPYPQQIAGNAIFAASLSDRVKAENLVYHYKDASQYLAQPFAPPGEMNLAPLPGKLKSSPVYLRRFSRYPDWNRDFNGQLHSIREYGAYSGNRSNQLWLPKLEIKPKLIPDSE